MAQIKLKIDEAFDFTLTQVEELKSAGISSYIETSSSASDESIISKYNYDWILNHKKWIRVVFNVKSREELNVIMDMEEKIRNTYNVAFDTGFGGNFREWELDWSFQLVNQKKKR